jgi:hypothetical protein
LEPIRLLGRCSRRQHAGAHIRQRGAKPRPIVGPVRAGIAASRELGHLPQLALLQPRQGHTPDVIAVKFVRSLGAIGRDRTTGRGTDAKSEDRNRLRPETPGRRLEVALAGLAVAHQQYGAVAAVALVLEHLAGGGEGHADVGGRIAQVVRAGRVEK